MKKSTTSSLDEEEKEIKRKIFQNKDYPKATRQFTRDGFIETLFPGDFKIDEDGYMVDLRGEATSTEKEKEEPA